MYRLLNDEDRLDLLNDILQADYSIKKKIERLKNEFPAFILNFDKLEETYKDGMNAREYIQVLHPNHVQPDIVKTDELTDDELNKLIHKQVVADMNRLIAGELDYEENCSRFIMEIRNGNAHLINKEVLEALADFLEKHMTEDAEWLFPKLGRKPRPATSEDADRIVAIIQEAKEFKGSPSDKLGYLATKFKTSKTEIQTILTDHKKRLFIRDACNDYRKGEITLDKLSKVVRKNSAIPVKTEQDKSKIARNKKLKQRNKIMK